jgi:large subunit ribosomal protein L3
MSLGLIGTKVGMSRMFFEDGKVVPVTIVKIDENLKITQIKIKDINDIYNSIQVTTGLKKIKNVTKPLIGHYNKANVKPGIGLWEFKSNQEEIKDRNLGDVININIFEKGQKNRC